MPCLNFDKLNLKCLLCKCNMRLNGQTNLKKNNFKLNFNILY